MLLRSHLQCEQSLRLEIERQRFRNRILRHPCTMGGSVSEPSLTMNMHRGPSLVSLGLRAPPWASLDLFVFLCFLYFSLFSCVFVCFSVFFLCVFLCCFLCCFFVFSLLFLYCFFVVSLCFFVFLCFFFFFLCFCWRVEDVISVLTLVRRGAAQVCHVLRVKELMEQLEVEEEEEGKEDGQEEEEEVESGEGRIKEKTTTAHMDDHG